ncbi:MAG: DUF2332 family protein, partial [Myxococcota bacterium]|nr:DUF2332 family protein [Myxococcota bacterium]
LADVRDGGRVARLLAGWQGDPVRGFLPLRLFGAVHGLVLAGRAPELAPYYPTVGGSGDAEAAWPAFLDVVARCRDDILPVLDRFPQTNEVRRCAGLLGGFLEIAARHGRPLRLREIGCSAGLNLQWARYAYALGAHAWGDAASPVRIAAEWQGPAPALNVRPEIESRAGCDIAPRGVGSDEDVRVLESYVWGDQAERLEQLRAAVRIAREEPPRVERARAVDWLRRELAEDAPGTCTVVYHSSVWSYLPDEEQAEVRALLDAAGARATSGCPVAWLRHEEGGPVGTIEIRVRSWPDGEERLLGRGHPHGRSVEWLGAPA